MFNKLMIVCLFLVSSFSAISSPIYIDHEGKDYWTSVDLGLDFLDLTTTEGYRYEELVDLSQEGNALEGWRLASGDESRALYQLFAGGMLSYQGWANVHYENALLWFRLFGHSQLFDDRWDTVTDTPTGYVTWVQVFNEDKIAANLAVDTLYGNEGWFNTTEYGFTNWALYEEYEITPFAGLMTRSSTSTAVSVPAPEPAMLMIMGLCLIGIRAFSKKK